MMWRAWQRYREVLFDVTTEFKKTSVSRSPCLTL
jgi:hypothetical protein